MCGRETSDRSAVPQLADCLWRLAMCLKASCGGNEGSKFLFLKSVTIMIFFKLSIYCTKFDRFLERTETKHETD